MSVNPLKLRICLGKEDHKLLEHIRILEGFNKRSEDETDILELCYERLDYVTDPRPDPLLAPLFAPLFGDPVST